MADVKAIYARVGAYVSYKFALKWSVLPDKIVLIAELAPAIRKDLRTYNSQFSLSNFCEKGSQGHFSLTLFDGITCRCAMQGAITEYSLW